jgi:hypothetical protein
MYVLENKFSEMEVPIWNHLEEEFRRITEPFQVIYKGWETQNYTELYRTTQNFLLVFLL